jgi:hypothetical protein
MPMQSRRCAKCSNLFFSSFPTPILWSFTDRVKLLVLWCCYGQIWLLDVRILCTEPRFCHWGPSAPKKIDKPGYVRYNTFFHAPKNNEGESNLTLITWFPHRRPLYRWMRLIKRILLVTGLFILKLTQPLIPAENPNSSKFNGTEGVPISLLVRVPIGTPTPAHCKC